MISPNKQNLIFLKNQKKLTQNGYKLLKEKRAGLIVYFLELSKNGKQLENELKLNHSEDIFRYTQFFSLFNVDTLNLYLMGKPSIYLTQSKKRISGVFIDKIHIEVLSPEREGLKGQVQNILLDFSHIFPVYIELIQLKLNCSNIAAEILKTNRQIANLEKKLEEIDMNIKYIRSVLSDKENLEKGILMKLFL